MTTLRLGEYCCQGGDKVINQRSFQREDLLISPPEQRQLFFSPLGNQPLQPRLAVVGITPGAQISRFEQLLRSQPVEIAARKAAFTGAQTAIKQLITAHDFCGALGIDPSGNLNDNDAVFTTSLVKCCLMSEKRYLYKAPDILKTNEAIYCLLNRFVTDMQKYVSLTHVAIFGAPGWEAVNGVVYGGRTVREYLVQRGITVLQFPHFAQNFQQRKIFLLEEGGERDYFRQNPRHLQYRDKATQMRRAVVEEVSRLKTTLKF